MARTIVVTGAGSGIGAATAARIRDAGDRAIGVDLRNSDVVADLATEEGRSAMIEAVGRIAPDGIDGIVAAAGVAEINQPALTVAVNFFGAVATLEGLRPLLSRSARPRAAVVVSTAALMDASPEVIDACLSGDEAEALQAAERSTGNPYMASKRALALWVPRDRKRYVALH